MARRSMHWYIAREAAACGRMKPKNHRDGLDRQARNPAGLPDSSGDLASAGGIAGVDITDHRRQVGTPHDGPAPIPQKD